MAVTIPTADNTPKPTIESVVGQETLEIPQQPVAIEGIETPVERNVPSVDPWDDLDRRYQFGKHNPEQVGNANKEMKTRMAQDILGKLVAQQDIGTKAALNLMAVVTTGVEDVYNFGVDVINFADRTFGDGSNLLEKSQTMASVAPKGTGWEVSREIGKFTVGYSNILKGVSAITNPASRAGVKGSQALAGLTTELLLAKPEMETLTESFIKNVPAIGDDVYAWLNDPEDTGLEARAKQSILGVAEGEMAEQVFNAVKMLGGLRNTQKGLDAPPPAPAKEVGEEAAKEAVDAPPPVPVEPELPPLPTDEFVPTTADIEKAKNVVRRQMKGQGSVNESRFVDNEGRASFMNLTNFDTTDDVRRVIDNMVKESPEQFGNRKYTTKEISEIADNLEMTAAELNAWSRETGLHMGQIKAGAELSLDASDSFINVSKRFQEGLATKEELAIAYSKASSLVSKTGDMKSMAGLLLKEADIPAKKGKLNPSQIRELTKVFGDDAVAASKAINGSDLPTNKIMRALKNIPITKLSDRITNLRHASNLSNPATHARNILGGFTNTAPRPGETLVAATLNAIEKNPRGVHFSDAYHELAGMAHGTMDAVSIAAQKLRGKEAEFLGVDPNKAKVFQAGIDANTTPKSVIGQGVDFIDKQVVQGAFVGEALRFEDNFIKHINAMMTLRREAYRKAKGITGLTTDEVIGVVSRELANPSKGTLKKMYKDAEYATLTNDLPSGLLKTLADVSTTNPIGRLIAPYAKVNLNAMLYKFERIPGLNLLIPDVRKRMNSLDPAIRQTQLGRMAFASTILTGLGAYLHQSDLIMGSGPKDSRKYKMFEQAGYQRDSIKVGDQWIEFRRETPVGGVLGLIADLADLRDMVNGTNDQYINDVGTATVAIVAELYNPEYLTSTVGTLFKAMADGDSKTAEAVINASVSIGTQFVPYAGAFRQFNRQLTEEGGIKRETFSPSSLIETFSNRVKDVYAPADLAIKRNILGEPILHKTGLGPDIVSPFGVTKEINDPVIQELAKLSGATNILDPQRRFTTPTGEDSRFRGADEFIDILMPQKSIRVGSPATAMMRDLTMTEYEQLVLFSSGNFEGGTPLKTTLKELFKQQSYKDSSFKMKGLMVKQIISRYHDMGRKMFQAQIIDQKEFKSALKQSVKSLQKQ